MAFILPPEPIESSVEKRNTLQRSVVGGIAHHNEASTKAMMGSVFTRTDTGQQESACRRNFDDRIPEAVQDEKEREIQGNLHGVLKLVGHT